MTSPLGMAAAAGPAPESTPRLTTEPIASTYLNMTPLSPCPPNAPGGVEASTDPSCDSVKMAQASKLRGTRSPPVAAGTARTRQSPHAAAGQQNAPIRPAEHRIGRIRRTQRAMLTARAAPPLRRPPPYPGPNRAQRQHAH